MRIAIGQLWQETNTFNPLPTTRSDFEDFGICRGNELVESMADTNELGGFIQSLRAWGEPVEIVGLVRLPAWPSGRATEETGRWLIDEVVGELRDTLPVDGVLLALHGSLAAEVIPDVEGVLLERVRDLVGASVPVVVTLDLHANVTRRMVRSADVCVPYHTAPHVDVFETGQRGAEVMRRLLVEKVRPTTAFSKIPMVVPAERANTQDPESVSFELRERIQQVESREDVLAVGLTTVQPWLDIPELGSSVVVTTTGDGDLAVELCREIAGKAWARRRDYLPVLLPYEEAVECAYHIDGFVVLSDSADATTSGAPGDSNWVLRELLKYPWTAPVVMTFVDPELVEEVRHLEPDTTVAVTLGGKRDTRFSKPLSLSVAFQKSFEARFVMSGHLSRNMPIDMGPSVVLRIGSIYIFVTSRSGPHFAPQLFESADYSIGAARVLVAKSPCGFRAAYQRTARWIGLVQAPGCAPSDFWNYPYEQIDRPLWPWDDMTWEPTAEVVE